MRVAENEPVLHGYFLSRKIGPWFYRASDVACYMGSANGGTTQPGCEHENLCIIF
jgi:hypothetical protein